MYPAHNSYFIANVYSSSYQSPNSYYDSNAYYPPHPTAAKLHLWLPHRRRNPYPRDSYRCLQLLRLAQSDLVRAKQGHFQ